MSIRGRASQKFFRPPYFFSALKSAVILHAKVLGIGIISSPFLSFSLLITAKQKIQKYFDDFQKYSKQDYGLFC